MIDEAATSVAGHLWQSTLFAALIAILVLAFRNAPARVRYWLWLSASAKFLVPFFVLVSIGGQFSRPEPDRRPPVRVVSAVEQVDQIFSALPSPSTLPMLPQTQSELPWAALACAWLGGFLAVLFSRWRSWSRMKTAVRDAKPLDVSIGSRTLSSAAFSEPAVFGIFRPVLLLPAHMATRLTAAEYAAVIAHELCHILRRDNLTQLIHMAVESIFWFHPIVWWIGARLLDERERACDEYVLGLGNRAQDYAGGILKICEGCVEPRVPCIAAASGANLARRIEQIMMWRASQLSRTRKTLLCAFASLVLCGPVAVGVLTSRPSPAQVSKETPRFEVASVRLCKDAARSDQKMGPAGGSPTVSPGRLNTGCALLAARYPMAGLIQRVYGRLGLGRPPALGSALPISGGPAWIYSDYYVISAESGSKASEEAMEGPMLQALLEDRFKLRFHKGSVAVPVYALTIAKGGPRLREVADGSCVQPDYSVYPLPPAPAGKRYCNTRGGVGSRKGPNTTIDQEGITVDYLCNLLTLLMDRPVVNRTGLKSKYDFHLEFVIDQATPGVAQFGPQVDNVVPGASIFTVVQQQLGLKLEPTRGERDTLVIDHIERPSEN